MLEVMNDRPEEPVGILASRSRLLDEAIDAPTSFPDLPRIHLLDATLQFVRFHHDTPIKSKSLAREDRLRERSAKEPFMPEGNPDGGAVH